MNATIKGLFKPLDVSKTPPVRVERIATCMGCVMATCVVDVDQVSISQIAHAYAFGSLLTVVTPCNMQVSTVTNTLVGWAKPIVQVQNNKAQVCLEWRQKLEGSNPNVMQQNSPNAAAAAASEIRA